MAMIKKLSKHGNSMALILGKPVLNLLHIDGDTPLDIATDGIALMIAPVQDPKRRAKFKRALASANRRYASALKKLAE
jgi:antitoxin component of MazEF toxin-antitoxin module